MIRRALLTIIEGSVDWRLTIVMEMVREEFHYCLCIPAGRILEIAGLLRVVRLRFALMSMFPCRAL